MQADGSHASWRRAAPWLAPAALLLLATLQLALSASAGLSPWKGGGFGMFSSNDHGGFRSVRVFAVEGEARRRMRLPPALAGRALRVRDLPSQRALERLASEVQRQLPEAFRATDALRIEVWRTRFDPETLAPRESLLSAFERRTR